MDHRCGSSRIEIGQLFGRGGAQAVVGAVVGGDDPEGLGRGPWIEPRQPHGRLKAVLIVVFVHGGTGFLREIVSMSRCPLTDG